MNATSNCKTWTLAADCAAASAGLTCGTKAGLAGCQCPAVTTNNYYVDPVAGSDTTNSGNFATGAQTPAACRFKTLSKAANTVITSGNKIIAATATLPGVFTESAPVNLSAGVTLTTSDAAPTPGNYRLNYTGSSGVAVFLANGSTLSGFTIANGNTASNLSNPAIAVGCSVGAVTVKNVILNGTSANGLNRMATGLQIGVVPGNTCTGSFTGIIADGFATGISVSTSAGVAPVLTNAHVLNIADGTVGVLVEAGTLSATDLLVDPHTAGTPNGYGVIVRPASNMTVALFVGTNPTIKQTSHDAIWLDNSTGMLPPQANLTNALVSDPTGASSGIRIEAGTLNISGTTSIVGADKYGIESVGGTTIATGLIVTNSGLDGVHVTGGSVSLHDTDILNSSSRNLWMNAGAVLIDDGSTITNATDSGILFAGGANSTLNVGGTTGAVVDVSTNGAHGISVAGAGTGAAVTIRRTNSHDNSLNGVNVALAANDSNVTVVGSDVYSNHANGVVVTGAPSSNATNRVLLDDIEVRLHTGTAANTGRGIWLHGNDAASNNITATVQNSRIHDNRDVGILIDEDTTPLQVTTTREDLHGNDIHDNNVNGIAGTVGGISFATSSTLTAFAANKIHHNGRDQIAFASKPTTGTTWDINAPGACSTATTAQQNKIYCYTLPGAIGLRTTAPNAAGAYSVDAAEIGWANDTVNANREYVQGANTMIVRATGPCAAVPCQ
jgi:hypothetical protein